MVATGAYRRYAPPLWDSASRHFLPDAERRLIVFSDQRCELPGAEWVRHPHAPWPQPTLHRYQAYLRARRRFADCDHVFCIDADMLFVDRVGEEVLGELVATTHPGFFASTRAELPYERRTESRAFVAPHEGGRYFAGAFVGGRRERFLTLARAVAAMVDADEAAGLVAAWHDESYLNRYLASFPPTLALSPAYCAPQSWSLPFTPRLLALDKDHASERRSIAASDGGPGGGRRAAQPGAPPARRAAARGRAGSTPPLRIAAVTVTRRPHLLSRVLATLEAQRRRPDAWLVFVHQDGDGVDAFFNLEERAREAGIATTFARRSRDLSRGRVRNEAMLRAEPFGIAAVIEDDDLYGPEYLAVLAQSVSAHAEGDLFGIEEHEVACVRWAPALDGDNLPDRRRADGSRVMHGDRASRCCPATLAVRCRSWLRLGLRYDETTGGEEEPLWRAAEAGELVLVRRPATDFYAVRHLHEETLGGPHAPAGGPVFDSSLGSPAAELRLDVVDPAAAVASGGLSIAVRQVSVGASRGILPSLLVEDATLPPGVLQIRGPGGHVLQVIHLLPDVPPRRRAGLEVVPVDGGFVVYDPSHDRVHFLNGTASLLLELCTGDSTVAQLAELLADAFAAEITAETVREAVRRLAEEGLLEP